MRESLQQVSGSLDIPATTANRRSATDRRDLINCCSLKTSCCEFLPLSITSNDVRC